MKVEALVEREIDEVDYAGRWFRRSRRLKMNRNTGDDLCRQR
jgi:hypothetical protein